MSLSGNYLAGERASSLDSESYIRIAKISSDSFQRPNETQENRPRAKTRSSAKKAVTNGAVIVVVVVVVVVVFANFAPKETAPGATTQYNH